MAESEIAAGRNQRARKSQPVENFQRGIGSVALRNAPQIELHFGIIEHGGVIRGIEVKFLVAGARRRRSQRLRIRQPAIASRLPPYTDHRALRDIERSATLFGELLSRRENSVQIVADRDRALHRGTTQTVQLAVGLVVGKNTIQLGDAVECSPERRFRALLVPSVQLDADQRPHVRFNGFEELKLLARDASGASEQNRRHATARHARHRCSSSDTSLRRWGFSPAAPAGIRATARRCDTRCFSATADPAVSRTPSIRRGTSTGTPPRHRATSLRERSADTAPSISPTDWFRHATGTAGIDRASTP